MNDIKQKIKEKKLESHSFLENEYKESFQYIKNICDDIDNDEEREDIIKVLHNGALEYKNEKLEVYITLMDKLLEDYDNSLKEFETNLEHFQNPQSKTLAKKNLIAIYEKVQNTFVKDKQTNTKNIHNFYELLDKNDISSIKESFVNNYDEYILRKLSSFQENAKAELIGTILLVKGNYKTADIVDKVHNTEAEKNDDDFWGKFIVFAVILSVIMTIASFIFSFALFTGKTFAIIVIGATIISWIL